MCKTLLLVEDEGIIALCEKRMLEKFGYTVLTVGTGEAAAGMDLCSPEIHLILMDMDLGVGMDGVETAAKILETYDIPVVFLSSQTELLVMEETKKVRSYGYVMKNSDTVILDAVIKMALKLFEANRSLHQRADRFPASNPSSGEA